MNKRIEEREGSVVRVDVVEEGVRSRSGWIRCQIGHNLEFSADTLASYFFASWERVVFDGFLLAAAVEFCDRIKRRHTHKWTRTFELRLPVHDTLTWGSKSVVDTIHHALEFLTGDSWHIQFVRRQSPVPPPRQGLFELPPSDSPVVIPFSEGLDSRAVAGLMGREIGERLIRVRVGKKSYDRPKEPSGRMHPFTAIPYRVRPGPKYRFVEPSARSRGFKFALISGLAAHLAKAERIIIPESGQGALGVSLVPVGHAYEDYRNHPEFTARMTAFLKALVGSDLSFEFPRLWFTKGETLREYVLGSEANVAWANTRSCWQDNRQVSVNRHRRQCGICAACMLRRLSVHAAGLSEDSETYIWEDLRAKSFQDGAAAGFRKISAQRDYAIAGTLHLDHLASLRKSPVQARSLGARATELSKALREPQANILTWIDRLLRRHEKEWEDFMDHLGPDSFVVNWTERAA